MLVNMFAEKLVRLLLNKKRVMPIKLKTSRRERIKMGIRKNLEGTSQRPRLSVFRSNKAIYAQIIDVSLFNLAFSSSAEEAEAIV